MYTLFEFNPKQDFSTDNLTVEHKTSDLIKQVLNESHSEHFFKLIYDQKFIDNSMLIGKIVSDPAFLITFIYPHNHGKSVILSMLYTFLSRNISENKQKIFTELKIGKSTEAMKYLGQKSVIFLDFDDVKPKNYNDLVKLLSQKIAMLYREHNYLADKVDKDYVNTFSIYDNADKNPISESRLSDALRLLTQFIATYNLSNNDSKINVKPFVLIDGYDRPTSFLGSDKKRGDLLISKLLDKALKGNDDYLCGATLMGSTRNVAIIPNNSRVYSLNSSFYSKYFELYEQESKIIKI